MKYRPRPAIAFALFSVIALGLSGCKKPQIRAYLAPKDVPVPVPDEHAGHDHGPEGNDHGKPQITYVLPAGWTEATPNSVSLASFSIKSGTAEANVSATPLPNLAGREALVVNMWRDQAGLPPIEDAELAKTLEPVEIGGEKGQMFEVLGAKEGGAPLRIVTAFVHRPDASWFYKLSGDEGLVAAQKPTFIEFLKTVRVVEGSSAPAPATTKNSEPSAGEPKWSGPVPEGWQRLTAGQMQIAKFAVPEKDGAKAEVSISVFPSDTGGTLANVNRWRQQLGLDEIDSAALAPLVAPLDPSVPEAQLITLTAERRALVGAIVPRDGRWWFYKMMGDAPAVTAARDSFVAFAKSQP